MHWARISWCRVWANTRPSKHSQDKAKSPVWPSPMTVRELRLAMKPARYTSCTTSCLIRALSKRSLWFRVCHSGMLTQSVASSSRLMDSSCPQAKSQYWFSGTWRSRIKPLLAEWEMARSSIYLWVQDSFIRAFLRTTVSRYADSTTTRLLCQRQTSKLEKQPSSRWALEESRWPLSGTPSSSSNPYWAQAQASLRSWRLILETSHHHPLKLENVETKWKSNPSTFVQISHIQSR